MKAYELFCLCNNYDNAANILIKNLAVAYQNNSSNKLMLLQKTQEFKSSNKKWTDEEKQILEDMIWEGLSIKEIQKHLPNRSIEAIRKQIYRMNTEGGKNNE